MREECPGAGFPTKKLTRKRVWTGGYPGGYAYKYECPACGKAFARKKDGSLNKHTIKVDDPEKFVEQAKKYHKVVMKGGCANCGADLYEIDYLCDTCRNAS